MGVLAVILQILGSLGVFLYGMKVMSEGVQKLAGDRMRKIMATMTKHRVAGILTGLGITSLVQSSSASTVMVVSFVNAGLLTLVESIGVIMGANLGTTLTAWIIAAVGKFSLSSVAVPIIGVALPIFFIARGRGKSIGETLIGFGLLFFGLGLLKDAVPDVKSMLASEDPAIVEQARAALEWVGSLAGHGYLSLLIFLVLGVMLTLIVQSSSAAMAITVTLALNGWIAFEESAAIVLGENIGTTVTAWLAALGANLNAKRSARAHFLFNVIGVAWMLVLFYPFAGMVEWLGGQLPASFRAGDHNSDIGFSLAIFHSLFNLANICLLVWFVPQIARVVTRWIPGDEAIASKPRLKFISQSMVDVGELNLPEAEQATLELARLTQRMFEGYLTVFETPESDLSELVRHLKEMEDDADVLTHDITGYLVKCSAAEISPQNADSIARMIRIVTELEEISDTIYRLIRVTEKKFAKKRDFTTEASQGVQEISRAVQELIHLYNTILFKPAQDELLQTARELEGRTDALKKRLNKAAMRRIQNAGEVRAEMMCIDMHNLLEVAGNHARNILETAFYQTHPDLIPQKYDRV